MKLKEYHFKTEEIEATLADFESKGITELSVYDDSFADNKQKIIQFLKAVEKKAPFLFVALKINPKIIDFDKGGKFIAKLIIAGKRADKIAIIAALSILHIKNFNVLRNYI